MWFWPLSNTFMREELRSGELGSGVNEPLNTQYSYSMTHTYHNQLSFGTEPVYLSIFRARFYTKTSKSLIQSILL